MKVTIKLRGEGNSEPYRSATEEAIHLARTPYLMSHDEVGAGI